MADGEINSSDFEDNNVSLFQPKKTTGKRLSEKILQNQAVDRTSSKKAARTLNLLRGAPGTASKLSFVSNTWKTFCQTVKHDLDQCSNSKLIFRFIYTLVANTQSNLRGKHAPSLSTIQGLWLYTIEFLKFQHRDLRQHYTEYDEKRISTWLDQQVTLGKLIRGRWVERQWLGLVMILKLVRAMVEHSLAQGCLSWDIIIVKILGVVLACACNSRSGDVARSDGYTNMEYLQFQHVELTLRTGGTSAQDLRAKVTLKYTKEFKRDLNIDQGVFFDPLENPTQSVICPIKLLLVHALHHGYVHGSTIQEVLNHTARRVDRNVQWKMPAAPVLCQLSKSSAFLKLDRPAPQNQINANIKKMALLAGVLVPVTSRAIRAGGARDVTYLNKTIRGVASSTTALIVNHSRVSLDRGTTAGYVGALQETVYNLKAADPFEDRLAPRLAAVSWQSKKLKAPEVDQYMDAHNMDKSDANERQRTHRAMKNDALEDWRETERNRTTSDPIAAPQKHRETRPALLPRNQNLLMSTPMLPLEQPDVIQAKSRASIPHVPALISVSTATELTTPGDESWLSAIDPRLQEDQDEIEVDPEAFQTLCSMILESCIDDSSNTTSAPPDATEDVQGQLLELLTQEESISDACALAGDDFVNHFATINVFKNLAAFNHASASEVATHVSIGHSRNEPTPFIFHCQVGCGYKSWNPNWVVVHEITCDGLDCDDELEKVIRCPKELCDKAYSTEQKLQCHIEDVHNWIPKRCELECTSEDHDEVFESYLAYQSHYNKYHNDLPSPQECPLAEECLSDQLFSKKRSLAAHLRRAHRLTPEEIRAHMPIELASEKFSSCCIIEGCKSTASFTAPAYLRQHLVHGHKMTQEEAERLVPLNSKAKKAATKKAKRDPNLGKGCPISACTSEKLFPSISELKRHLTSGKHKIGEQEAKETAESVFGKSIGKSRTKHKQAPTEDDGIEVD